jgi:hypothetical protein
VQPDAGLCAVGRQWFQQGRIPFLEIICKNYKIKDVFSMETICTDGMPRVPGYKSGPASPVKVEVPQTAVNFCILQKYPFDSKTMHTIFKGVTRIFTATQVVNFTQVRAKKIVSSKFSAMWLAQSTIFSYSVMKIRWLS